MLGLKSYFDGALYSSATLTESGNSGRIATPAQNGGDAIFPVWFRLVGTGLATDETAAVSIVWFGTDSSVASIAQTTFDTITAGSPADYEAWPGDATFFNAARDFVPLPPYMHVQWTLAGSTISLSFEITFGYLRLGE